MTIIYCCDKCLKTFNVKSKYDAHMKRKTPCDSKTSFTCYRCLKIFIKKSTYDNHLKRKTLCKIKINEYKCDKCLKIFIKKSTYDNHIKRKTPCNKENNEFICKNCNKQFTTNGNLTRHIKNNNCAISLLNDKMDKILEKKNTINTTNITNNIQIVAYNVLNNSEFLQKSDYVKILNRCFYCIQAYIEHVYCNPKTPERNNIYISNLVNEYIQIYDGEKWTIENKTTIINELMTEVKNILEDAFDEYKEHLNDSVVRSFTRFIDIDKDKNSKRYIKYKNDATDEIMRILYNHRIYMKRNKMNQLPTITDIDIPTITNIEIID